MCMSTISESSSSERGRIRHARYMGLEKWRVSIIIGLLPILLHVSLGLFLAGLSVYPFKFDILVASGVAIISGCVYAAGELEWDLLENAVMPFLSQSSTLCPKIALAQRDLTCLQTGFPSLNGSRVLIRVFEEVGGILSLYIKFKDASLPGRQKYLPAYLTGHVRDMMIVIDTFASLHISGLGSSAFSFVENLTFLTRLLLYKLDWAAHCLSS
ncbi:hypothetical protein IW261DRAFT_193245 [Armillaria novae-zelandiae]|uniref:DUF6535 domain-containing protein n=1 Tax=Armillaria novae-zelandiae TaxID=153914 RepID=A0AA39P870_9AGAR|nr:hypothetical protein IW261DRAFT_193245 [Armillaria novae-zelandiae]